MTEEIQSGTGASLAIRLDGREEGLAFGGIGAVSAGGSSRLLIDYPEPCRSEILDYLFKPGFGAAFAYLKTEIGGDGNTTCGSEPSIARTRDEMSHPNYYRGYEYWLMSEARRRNPAIELDALEWCMPGWFADNKPWTQDNADYIVAFIKGAQSWGLEMNYIGGCWNERNYDRDWVVNNLRPTLDRNGLSHIRIVALEGGHPGLEFCDELIDDLEFRDTLSAVSVHYADSYMRSPKDDSELAGPNAWNCGVPLWSGEDFSLSGKPWSNALYMAKSVLRCYIRQRIVKVNMWCPIASMPDNACFCNVGLMKANEPWSGYYEVWPTIWAAAHFNQFVHPGWKYLDGGCGLLPGDGAYCTYKKPDDSGHYSIVIVNGDAAQSITFHLSHLSAGTLHVWKSDGTDQMAKRYEVTPTDGTFTLELDADSIYTLTTTTGQMKGSHEVPVRTPFPVVYSDDFESYSLNQAPLSPKYFYDNSGAFEICESPGEGKVVRQMLNNDIIHWIPDACAFTFVAQGTEWEDGEIASNVFVEEQAFNGIGYAGIIARGSYEKKAQADIPIGYRLNIYKDGTWKLLTKTKELAGGPIDADRWHHLRLACDQNRILAYIDGSLVADIVDSTYPLGSVGYNSGWNKAKFDQLYIQYRPVEVLLVSEWKASVASSEAAGREAYNAFDGNTLSKWSANGDDLPQWLGVDLGRPYPVKRCETFMGLAGQPYSYLIEHSIDQRHWKVFADRSSSDQVAVSPCYVDVNDEAMARYLRITILGTPEGEEASVYAFKVYAAIEGKR
ncbi:discoidin domain-containing protein [Paenibacillus lautus]|uniref:discoidin domain-containing protein n=1 Tax=Paenibacillus lautus TaxID=1401 RepID=UPI001C129291|nr:discoidin domain-containing protein [Paenibacillus lautus]MBU5346312.1 discoidin domain-containing protein [Paenibacillus lautus]